MFIALSLYVCLFVCLFVWVKPENLYFAPCVWSEVITPGNGCTWNQAQKLSFTQDGLAFSTKTAQRALHVAKVGNLQVDELALLSRSTEHADLTCSLLRWEFRL